MSALSDYLESGVLRLLFHNIALSAPANMSIALTSGVPQDGQTGATIPELQVNNSGVTGYGRKSYSTPETGESKWNYTHGSGIMSNAEQIVFNTAVKDWGPVSGLVILDSQTVGSGNVLFAGALDNPRNVFIGDSIVFEADELKILLN